MPYASARNLQLNADFRIFLEAKSVRKRRQTIKARKSLSSVTPSKSSGRAGILTGYPSAAAFAIALGSPNPWMIAIATETWDFRGLGFSPNLGLLIPTFSLPNTPAALAGPPSTQFGMLSYHDLTSVRSSVSSVSYLAPVHFWRNKPSNSELLRTL